MNNNTNDNTSGDNPFRLSTMLSDLNMLRTCGRIFWRQYFGLVDENTDLKTEKEKLEKDKEKLEKDNAGLEQKYQNACFSSQKALQKIGDQKSVIKKQEKTIAELKREFSIQSTQNKKNNNVFSVDQNDSFSLLGKIKSLKNDLKPCKSVECNYMDNNKNQQTK